MSKVRHCLFIVFLQSEEYSVWGILSSQTREKFSKRGLFPSLCNFISQTRGSFAAESKSRLFQGQMKQVLA